MSFFDHTQKSEISDLNKTIMAGQNMKKIFTSYFLKLILLLLLVGSWATPSFADAVSSAYLSFVIADNAPTSSPSAPPAPSGTTSYATNFNSDVMDTSTANQVNLAGSQNFRFIQLQNFTTAATLALSSNVADAYEGTSLKVNLDFGSGPASASNWGAFLMEMQTRGDTAVSLNLAEGSSYSFYAKALTGMQIAIGLKEADGDMWISNKAMLRTTYNAYRFGINPTEFKLNVSDSTGNGIFEPTRINQIFTFMYKDVLTGQQTVYIDKIEPSNVATADMSAPVMPQLLAAIPTTARTTNTVSTFVEISSDTATLNISGAAYTLQTVSSNVLGRRIIFTGLAEGTTTISIQAVDTANNKSFPLVFRILVDSVKPAKPVVRQASTTSNVTVYTFPVEVDNDTASLQVYMQGLVTTASVSLSTANTPVRTFIVSNLVLTASSNIVTVVAVDSAGNVSPTSDAIQLNVKAREVSALPPANDPGSPARDLSTIKPYFVTVPAGSQNTDEAPVIGFINVSDIVQSPAGQVSSGTKFVDITLSGSITSATVSLPLPDGGINEEPWYFDTTQRKWVKTGISNAFIETKSVVNGAGDTVSARYLTFTVSHFSIYGVFVATDTNVPIILTLSADRKGVQTGDILSKKPLVTAVLTDTRTGDSGIATWNITVWDATSGTAQSSTTGNALSAASLTVTHNVNTELTAGHTYEIRVTAYDASGLATTQNVTSLSVPSSLAISDLVNGPNPFNPNNGITRIQYRLSADADVKIYIYSITGERIWTTSVASGSSAGGAAGLNTVNWDGRNDIGEMVSNGMYIAYVMAENATGKKVSKLKIGVLK